MVFLPPLPKVGCPIFLEIGSPWGKVMKRSGLTFEHFCMEMVLNRRTKKVFFFADFFKKKLGFGVFLVHPPMASVLLSASVERCFVSRMRDFCDRKCYKRLHNICKTCKKLETGKIVKI